LALNRGKAQKIIPLFEKYDVTLHTILLGRGTANSEILSYLGLAETSKDIVLSFVKKNKILSIYEELNPYLKRNGNGISFTIPLTSMVGMTMYKFLTKGGLNMAHIISDECISCGACAGTCPVSVISENLK